MKNYNHKLIESKWQKAWEKAKLYTPDVLKSKNKFYNLFMFPYPSAEGLHAGHAFSSTGSDIYGRFMRMNGKTVFQPMGYDSFGIHPENYAIKTGEHPKTMLDRTIKHYEEQFKSLGHGYDWTRTVTTSDPNYYKWTQWLFIEMFKAGLAYRKKAEVNFCPSCKTVLADEQVMTPKQAGKEPKDKDGNSVPSSDDLKVCERCGTVAEKRNLEQWFFKITDYADRLLEGLDKIDWSKKVKVAQKEWIGKSEGMIIEFKVKNSDEVVKVFTTRPDTLESATFIATSSKKLKSLEITKEKLGVFTKKYAVSPINGRELPIWETNYVEENYGTGVVMGVPAYDERDMEFAKKYSLDILNNSLNEELWNEIPNKKWGIKYTNYHLRDWLVSRQRYWGAPIPMVHCDKCNWQAVPESELPVILPDIKDYKPEGNGRGPLANHPEFFETKCPKCGGEATRETDVMDTFVDSSWYFLRYPSTRSARSGQVPFDPEISKAWLPVDLYFGGAEHSVLHLMYARFVNMVLHDRGYLDHDEPFPRFFAHGLMIKDGAKMSKSRGNVVNPDIYVEKYGADTLRLYVMFMGPMDGSPDFRDSGIEGMSKFLKRVWNIFTQTSDSGSSLLRVASQTSRSASADQDFAVMNKLHQTIKGVSEDIEEFKYNTAIAKIMELVNVISSAGSGSSLLRVASQTSRSASADQHEILNVLCQLLAPFAPHMTEEVWHEVLGQKGSVHTSNWPKYDEKYINNDNLTIAIQVNGKLRSTLIVNTEISDTESEVVNMAKNDEKIVKWLAGKEIKKTIFVSGKLINFVLS